MLAFAPCIWAAAAQAYNDDDVPPAEAVSNASRAALQLDYWGKRTMTNDFAHVVHRTKALGAHRLTCVHAPAPARPTSMHSGMLHLVAVSSPAAGFNAIRLPFNFTNLAKDLPVSPTNPSEFFACVVSLPKAAA